MNAECGFELSICSSNHVFPVLESKFHGVIDTVRLVIGRERCVVGVEGSIHLSSTRIPAQSEVTWKPKATASSDGLSVAGFVMEGFRGNQNLGRPGLPCKKVR